MRFLLRMGNRELVLTPGRWCIGRDPSCEIRIDNDLVSRRHALLHVGETQTLLEDLGSSNGVVLNEKRIFGSVQVHSGDRFCVGAEEFGLTLDVHDKHAETLDPTRTLPKLSEARPASTSSGLESLSPREKEVLEFLAQGYAQRAIAEKIGVSIKTIETYRSRITVKLGLKTRTELIQYALKSGILRPPS